MHHWSLLQKLFIAGGFFAALGWHPGITYAQPITPVLANTLPTGGTVARGNATIAPPGVAANGRNTLQINQTSTAAVINWNSFNVGSNATVNFQQPAGGVTLNRVNSNQGSEIYGQINATGGVFLVNPAGVLFAPGAQVNVGSLVASTLDISDNNFIHGSQTGNYQFNSTPRCTDACEQPNSPVKRGEVINQGNLTAADGGSIALLGQTVKNEGIIAARLGTVALASGQAISLQFQGSKLFKVNISQAEFDTLIDNKGLIKADGGWVLMNAQTAQGLARAVVNHSGVIEAQTVADLQGSQQTGKVEILADFNNGQANISGRVDASAPNGGNGGSVETSAADVRLQAGHHVTTNAPQGRTGTWLIDPTNIQINQSSCTGTNCLSANDIQAGLVNNNVTIATAAAGTEAGNITIQRGTNVTWATNNTLTLDAHGSIQGTIIGGGSVVLQGADGNLVLRAGRDINLSPSYVNAKNIEVFAGNDLIALELYGASNVAVSAGNNITKLILGYANAGNRSVEFAATAGGNINVVADDRLDSLIIGDAGTLSGIVAGGSVTVKTSRSAEGDGASINVNQQIVAGASSTIRLQAGAALDREQNYSNTTEGRQGYAGGSINVDARLSGGAVVLAGGAGGAGETNGQVIVSGGAGGVGGAIRIRVSQPVGSGAWQIAAGQGGNGGSTSASMNVGGRGGDAGQVIFSQGSPLQVGSLSIAAAAGGQGGVNRATPVLRSSDGNHGVVTGNVQVQASGGISIAPRIFNATADVLLQAGTGITNGAGGVVVVDAAQLNLRNTTSGDVLANNTGNITVTGNSNVGRMQLASSAGNITLNGAVNASATGDAIRLAAYKNFINNGGSAALTVANGSRWLVWSQSPIGNSFGGLQSGNAALWGTAFNAANPTVAGTANQFIFSDAQPTGFAVAADDVVKTYGDAYSFSGATQGNGYRVISLGSGASWGNAFTDAGLSTAGISLSGAPVLTSSGADAAARRDGGIDGGATYAINLDASGMSARDSSNNAVALAAPVSGVLNVTPRALTGNVTAETRAYDGTTNATVAGSSVSGLVNGNTAVSLTPASVAFSSANAGNNVGLTLGGSALSGADAVNYTLASVSGSGTINRREVTISGMSADGRQYNGNTSATLQGGTVNNLVGSETLGFTGASGEFANANAGTWGVTVSGATLANGTGANAGLASNYTLRVQPSVADATISRREVTITGMTAQDRAYNADTAATLQGGAVSNLVSGETLSFNGASGQFASANAGARAVTVSGATLADGTGANAGLASNYVLTAQPSGISANITPADLTITANNANRTYDGSTYSGGNGVSYSGFVGGEGAGNLSGTLSFSGSAQGSRNAGTFAITPDGLTSQNYAIRFANGSLTTDQANLTLTASSDSRVYNGLARSSAAPIATPLIAGDTLTGLSQSFDSANAGDRTLSVTGYTLNDGNGGNNYNISFVSASGRITPASLTIRANDASITQGQALPGFTASYLGFVNGESAANLTAQPQLGTLASSSSPQGSYAINANGASSPNYIINYVNGELQITPAILPPAILQPVVLSPAQPSAAAPASAPASNTAQAAAGESTSSASSDSASFSPETEEQKAKRLRTLGKLLTLVNGGVKN